MIEPVSVADLGGPLPLGLDLDADGCPQRPLVLVRLGDAVDPADVAAATRMAQRALPLLVGVADGPSGDALDPLVEQLDACLVSGGDDRRCVVVDDVARAAQEVEAAVDANPRAAVALGHLLRQTARLGVREGLAAEAAAYSMLLAGPEFAAWLRRRGPARTVTSRAAAPVLVERRGDVLAVTLDRAERRNAMDAALREALVEALGIAGADERLRVELRGAGPGFCSGGDLDEFGSAGDVVAAYLVRLERHPGWLMHQLRDRLHVRVHGACIGAGVEMPCFAGRVTAAPDAVFMLPEVGMGLVPGAGGTVSIPRRIGRWRTMWLALTGSRVDAATALAWGLVDEVEG